MRNLVMTVMFALVVTGCSNESVEMQGWITDATGTNELVLYDLVGRMPLSSRVDHDLHSLVWRVKEGTNWTDRQVISQIEFQGASLQRRWANEIAAFDGGSGTAIVKVGEESLPFTNRGPVCISVGYSWREWNLLTNGEVRVVRICKDPFKKY